MYIHAYIYIYIFTYVHTYIHTYVRTYIHTYIYIYTYIYRSTYLPTYLPIYLSIYLFIYIYGPMAHGSKPGETRMVPKNSSGAGWLFPQCWQFHFPSVIPFLVDRNDSWQHGLVNNIGYQMENKRGRFGILNSSQSTRNGC